MAYGGSRPWGGFYGEKVLEFWSRQIPTVLALVWPSLIHQTCCKLAYRTRLNWADCEARIDYDLIEQQIKQ